MRTVSNRAAPPVAGTRLYSDFAKTTGAAMLAAMLSQGAAAQDLAYNAASEPEPIPLRILALDVSSSQRITDGVALATEALTSREAQEIFDAAGGKQAIAIITWGRGANVVNDRFHIVSSGEDALKVFETELASSALLDGVKPSNTDPRPVYPLVKELSASIEAHGYALYDTSLLFVSDGAFYSTTIDRYIREAAQEACITTEFLFSTDVPESQVEYFQKKLKEASYTEDNPYKPVSCYETNYPNHPLYLPENTVHVPKGEDGEFNLEIFEDGLRGFYARGLS